MREEEPESMHSVLPLRFIKKAKEPSSFLGCIRVM